MRLLAFVLFAAGASCGASLGDAAQPADPPGTTTTTLPEWTDADCVMFNPTACRMDLAKATVGIDVHYPNTFFCRLQLLATVDLLAPEAFGRLASGWQATIGYGPNNQVVATSEMGDGVLEYGLGSEQLYLTRVTFTAKAFDTVEKVVGNALGPGVSLYAVPVECPGR